MSVPASSARTRSVFFSRTAPYIVKWNPREPKPREATDRRSISCSVYIFPRPGSEREKNVIRFCCCWLREEEHLLFFARLFALRTSKSFWISFRSRNDRLEKTINNICCRSQQFFATFVELNSLAFGQTCPLPSFRVLTRPLQLIRFAFGFILRLQLQTSTRGFVVSAFRNRYYWFPKWH